MDGVTIYLYATYHVSYMPYYVTRVRMAHHLNTPKHVADYRRTAQVAHPSLQTKIGADPDAANNVLT